MIALPCASSRFQTSYPTCHGYHASRIPHPMLAGYPSISIPYPIPGLPATPPSMAVPHDELGSAPLPLPLPSSVWLPELCSSPRSGYSARPAIRWHAGYAAAREHNVAWGERRSMHEGRYEVQHGVAKCSCSVRTRLGIRAGVMSKFRLRGDLQAFGKAREEGVASRQNHTLQQLRTAI